MVAVAEPERRHDKDPYRSGAEHRALLVARPPRNPHQIVGGTAPSPVLPPRAPLRKPTPAWASGERRGA